jgi:hypothetical protein
MKHHYALISEDDQQNFVNAVNTAMNEGWVPLGGVTSSPLPESDTQDERTRFSQAMIRKGVNGVDIAH